MNRKGFTLVEIVIAIAILSILIALTIPGVLRMRQEGRSSATQAELSSIYKAFVMFNVNTNRHPEELSEFDDYITIHDMEDKYELNPNLP